jgi:succinate dehydrogenase/fumarate reductase cytochrome b subunit
MVMGDYHSIVGLIILILDLWAIISVINSGEEIFKKVLWVALVLILPLIGFIIWLFAGPRSPIRKI